jgi:hypothetical protein
MAGLFLQPSAVWTAHSSFVGPDHEVRKTGAPRKSSKSSKGAGLLRTTHMAKHENAAPMNSIKLFHVGSPWLPASVCG